MFSHAACIAPNDERLERRVSEVGRQGWALATDAESFAVLEPAAEMTAPSKARIRSPGTSGGRPPRWTWCSVRTPDSEAWPRGGVRVRRRPGGGVRARLRRRLEGGDESRPLRPGLTVEQPTWCATVRSRSAETGATPPCFLYAAGGLNLTSVFRLLRSAAPGVRSRFRSTVPAATGTGGSTRRRGAGSRLGRVSSSRALPRDSAARRGRPPRSS